jgi:pyridoxal 5'-phosphate synthase pdxT subunit
MTRIGVLALQGAFREHVQVLRRLGADAREIRLPGEIEGLDGLVIPGGESTTVGKLMEIYGLTEPLREFVNERPVLGTCAGLILLARHTTGEEQPLLGAMDIVVQRNAFGRQVHSFEAPVQLRLPGNGGGDPFPGVFIRAPWVEHVGAGVEVVAVWEGHVVGVYQDNLLGLAFHPELTEDDRIHRFFLGMVERHAVAEPVAALAGA